MKDTHYLEKISSPEDLRRLPREAMGDLCTEIRRFLVERVKEHGGHLASNLGVVELTVALHRVFRSPHDRIIFDVGHQCYVHKMITGRLQDFESLRTVGGLSGFPVREESPHDPFGAGHASTALSAAIGFAEADRLAGRKNYTIAVLGDGAYTGGMVHEALNNCSPDLRLIVILNENEMSISKNIGSFARYIARLRSSTDYARKKKKAVRFLRSVPLVGEPCFRLLRDTKQTVKDLLYASTYFEKLGLFYLGPADGNDYDTVERLLRIAKSKGESSLVHLRTVKGCGYAPAEHNPGRYHSFPKSDTPMNYSEVFGHALCDLAENDDKIVAITAAMADGTGLSDFAATYPERFFDVGIAEAHATTFAAGLAAGGMKPFFAVYSTFLQRAYDNVLHDAALQNLPVRFAIDRAALASGDGPTHHGIFDVAFLSEIPNVTLYAPASFDSLRRILATMADDSVSSPVCVRYPNATENERVVKEFFSRKGEEKRFTHPNFSKSARPSAVVITYGCVAAQALRAADLLKKEGVTAGVILLERLKPYDVTAREILALLPPSVKAAVFLEEGVMAGGASMLLRHELSEEFERRGVRSAIRAIPDKFVKPTAPTTLYRECRLTGEDVAGTVKELLKSKKTK